MPVETTIHTVRHAHTVYNGEKRYAGTLDVPLSEKGIQDTRQAAPRLAGLRFDMVITSTLRRSIETARLLVGDGVRSLQSALCNERNFGALEGLTWDEAQQLQPPVLLINVGGDLHSVNPRGGEPFELVWQRAQRLRRLIFRAHKGSSVLVVSHGVFLQMFHGVLRGLSCIEALAAYPSSLELATFRFLGNRLAEERIEQLANAEAARW
ncbi:MAG TPA: histidine phosphatase family protein [Anaerolineae bacterium]|nr:histidine phosphatase family protein [Anaerolineae bacterium]